MTDGIAAASRSVGAAKAAVALTDVVVSFRVAVGTYTAVDRATLNVGDGEFVAIVETAALQPGEAETTENRWVHGSVELAAERKGSLIELVRTLGAVALEGHEG